ncbi:MAG: hypothetical protein WAK40_01465 [Thermoplasmata archaeon]
MNAPSAPLPDGGPGPRGYEAPRPHRWGILAAVAVAAIVVIGVLIWTLLPRARGVGGAGFPFGGFLIVFLVIWLSFMAIRVIFWSSRRQQYRGARWGEGPYRGAGFDPAIRTARLRYARGEITREQYDQIVSGLRSRPPPP